MRLPTERERAYIYNVLLALVPLLMAYGLATETQLAAILGLVSAVLGLSMARFNVSSKQR